MALSGKEEVVLDILRHEEMYGLEILKKSNGDLRRGGMYTLFSRMEDRGLISGRRVPSDHPHGSPKRVYRATKGGMQEFLLRHSFFPEATLVSV